MKHPSSPSSPTANPPSASSGLPPWAAIGLLVLPALAALIFVLRFGVDVPFLDEFNFIPLFGRLRQGQLTLAEVFAPHNEHPMFFPRLVLLAAGTLSGYNDRFFQGLAWLLLSATGAVLFLDHRRAVGKAFALTPLIPAAWLLWSLSQAENLLWGWQVSLMLSLFAAASAFALLGGVHRPGARLGAAIAMGVVASYSFLFGFLVWPVGWLWLRATASSSGGRTEQDPRSKITPLWALAGAVAAGVVLALYGAPHLPGAAQKEPRTPWGVMTFFFAVLGRPLSGRRAAAVALGAALCGLSLLLASRALRGPRTRGDASPSIAAPFLLLGLGAAAMIAWERTPMGPSESMAPRYASLVMPAFAAGWLLWIQSRFGRVPSPRRRWAEWAAGALVLAVQLGVGWRAWRYGAASREGRREAAAVLRTYRTRPDAELAARLHPDLSLVKEGARVLETNGWSVFRGSSAPRR